MGKYSYPLYITHYTVLFTVFSILIHNVLVYVVVSLPVILFITYALENWFQPAITRLFYREQKAGCGNGNSKGLLYLRHYPPPLGASHFTRLQKLLAPLKSNLLIFNKPNPY